MSKAKAGILLIAMIVIYAVVVTIQAVYVTNNRDTLENPTPMEFEEIFLDENEYEFLYETDNLSFHYRKKTDCFVIKDKRNGYSWKTGIDSLTKTQLEEIASISEEKENECVPAPTMSDTYVNRANSAISVGYYDQAYNQRIISSNHNDVRKNYSKASASVYKITYTFTRIDLTVEVIFTFSNKGINVSIPDAGITGTGQSTLYMIEVFPFLGAVGGEFVAYDFEDELNGYDNEDLITRTPSIEGYSILPDGSGGLIRFNQNTQEFSAIDLPVYGENAALLTYYYTSQNAYKEEKNASMPVFGMVHGYQQNAYLAYADKGDSFMHIMSVPYGLNDVCYDWTYAKFIYNFRYFQVYNQAGQGNFKIMNDRYHYDISMNYEFIEGDGTSDNLPATYIGVANAYKEVISAELTTKKKDYDSIPMRVDFIMADSQPAIIGNETVVVTNVNDVDYILNDLLQSNITNINTGLLGYQDGGITLQKKETINYNSQIGSKSEYKKLFSKYSALGIDISFAENYLSINSDIYNLSGKAAKHYNGWYSEYWDSTLGNDNIPMSNYLRSDVAIKYATKQINKAIKDTGLTSYTISGISNKVVNHYRETAETTMSNYSKIFETASDKLNINASKPNSYLWPYITRYLNASAFNTQYLIETDTIPFISYILNDYIEVYADYSNFSFYDENSILRMIDYNMLPSFVLSKQSSHLLAHTNSNIYYSTEYELYKDKIKNVYDKVNDALKQVYQASWINRDVLVAGVIKNDYSNGKSIIINYTDNDFTYKGTVVKSMSSVVIA